MINGPRVVLALLLAGLAMGIAVGRGSACSRTQSDIPSFARDLPAIKSGEPIFRFNGKDLTGFYPYLKGRGRSDPNGVFTVRDGVIDVSGQEFGGLTLCSRDVFSPT